jgi:phosphoribosylanthranilate isomerase
VTLLKICGITREEDALYCAERGVDFLGFIFVPDSKRFVEPKRAAAIAAAVRTRGERNGSRIPRLVGVFRDASPEWIGEIVSLAGLDLVQCHGDETDDDLQRLPVPAIQVFRMADRMPDTSIGASAQWLLFDTYDDRHSGGTGRRFDWSLLAAWSRDKPFFLSGGIDAENVAGAISLVRPDAIDIASGVESEPGIKDREKLDRLFALVKGNVRSSEHAKEPS